MSLAPDPNPGYVGSDIPNPNPSYDGTDIWPSFIFLCYKKKVKINIRESYFIINTHIYYYKILLLIHLCFLKREVRIIYLLRII